MISLSDLRDLLSVLEHNGATSIRGNLQISYGYGERTSEITVDVNKFELLRESPFSCIPVNLQLFSKELSQLGLGEMDLWEVPNSSVLLDHLTTILSPIMTSGRSIKFDVDPFSLWWWEEIKTSSSRKLQDGHFIRYTDADSCSISANEYTAVQLPDIIREVPVYIDQLTKFRQITNDLVEIVTREDLSKKYNNRNLPTDLVMMVEEYLQTSTIVRTDFSANMLPLLVSQPCKWTVHIDSYGYTLKGIDVIRNGGTYKAYAHNKFLLHVSMGFTDIILIHNKKLYLLGEEFYSTRSYPHPEMVQLLGKYQQGILRDIPIARLLITTKDGIYDYISGMGTSHDGNLDFQVLDYHQECWVSRSGMNIPRQQTASRPEIEILI